MAELIRVNTNRLQKDTESIIEHLGQVKTEIQNMEQDVVALNKMWEGDTNESFNQLFLADIEKLNKVCDAIQQIIQYEATAKSEYNKCEQNVSEMISSISV